MQQEMTREETMLRIVERKLDEQCQRLSELRARMYRSDDYDYTGELAGITGYLKGLRSAIVDCIEKIKKEEKC